MDTVCFGSVFCQHRLAGKCPLSFGKCEYQVTEYALNNITGTAPNPEGGKCSTGTTDKPDHEAQ